MKRRDTDLYFFGKQPTCDQSEGTEASKGRDIDLQAVQTATELHDVIQPLPKGSLALATMQDRAIAEDQLGVIAPGAIRKPENE